MDYEILIVGGGLVGAAAAPLKHLPVKHAMGL